MAHSPVFTFQKENQLAKFYWEKLDRKTKYLFKAEQVIIQSMKINFMTNCIS